jgi:hypothetical protein
MTSDGIESDHMDQAKRYCVTLYQHATPDEFHWSENQTIGFLGTRLSSLAEAQQVLAEVEEKGAVTRYIGYGFGNKARVVVSAT